MSTNNGHDAPPRVEVPDDEVTFVLPGGRGEFACSPPDVIDELDQLQQQLAGENKSLWDYYRAVAQYVVGHMPEGAPLMTVGQAENFNHSLRLFWAKKKAQQKDAMRDALGLASSLESMLAN